MSDWDSIAQDALDDETRILEANSIIEPYCFDIAKQLKRNAKINEQPPIVQKYWLGRFAFELAMRNEEVKAIYKKAHNLSDTIDYSQNIYDEYTPKERYLILQLDNYGFTSKPLDNVLKTEHTSFPARLNHIEYGYIEVNTIGKIQKLLDILDGATAKQSGMNIETHTKWINIGNAYVEFYQNIINIIEYEDDGISSDYISH